MSDMSSKRKGDVGEREGKELVGWRSQSPSNGYFEVNGVPVDVPPDAEPGEVKERLTGRTIVEMQWDEGFESWFVLFSDGQIAEFSGIWMNTGDARVGVRFWWPAGVGECGK